MDCGEGSSVDPALCAQPSGPPQLPQVSHPEGSRSGSREVNSVGQSTDPIINSPSLNALSSAAPHPCSWSRQPEERGWVRWLIWVVLRQ